MSARRAAAVLAAAILCLAARAAAQEHLWTLVARGTLTTSSQLFPNPNSSDAAARARSYELNAAFGYGAELRYFLSDAHVALGISAEYLQAKLSLPIVLANSRNEIPVSDGYTVIPVELSGYFLIPFSGRTFGVYMGGGVGIYPGWREYSVGNVASTTGSVSPGAGIHVLAGISYRPFPRLSVLGEMKFRDLQFKATNTFPRSRVVYQGISVPVSATNQATIHTDGVIFQLSVGLSL